MLVKYTGKQVQALSSTCMLTQLYVPTAWLGQTSSLEVRRSGQRAIFT